MTSHDIGAGAGRGTASAKANSGSASDLPPPSERELAERLVSASQGLDAKPVLAALCYQSALALLSAEAQITRLEARCHELLNQNDSAETEVLCLSALLDQAREVVSWALPFANQALEEHRVERLRCGHGDIGAERGTDIGLWDSEVETRDAARAFLNSLSKRGEEGGLQTNVDPQCGVGPSDLTDQQPRVSGAGEGE